MTNQPNSGPKPAEGFILPVEFLPLYNELNSRGWMGIKASTSLNKEKEKVQHLLLKKDHESSFKGGKFNQLRLQLERKGGKIRCLIYTDPIIPGLMKRTFKDETDVQIIQLILEIIDFEKMFEQKAQPSPDITEVAKGTREVAMKVLRPNA